MDGSQEGHLACRKPVPFITKDSLSKQVTEEVKDPGSPVK